MQTRPNIPAVSSERCFDLARPVWARSEGDMKRVERQGDGKQKERREKRKEKRGWKEAQPVPRVLHETGMRRAEVRWRRSTPPSVSSGCLLLPPALFPCEPERALPRVFEWVKHCHGPTASPETPLQTDWRSTAKGSHAACVSVYLLSGSIDV